MAMTPVNPIQILIAEDHAVVSEPMKGIASSS